MKYETPEVVELTSAISSVQNGKNDPVGDVGQDNSPAYEDWE
jgi:hypothetical protein